MDLLVCCWGYFQEPLLCKILEEMEISYIKLTDESEKYSYDDNTVQKLVELIHREDIKELFSYNFFPLLAKVCEIKKIPYISKICDLENISESEMINSPYSYIFYSDRRLEQRIQNLGTAYCEYYPLDEDYCHEFKNQIKGMFMIVHRLWHYNDLDKILQIKTDIQWLKNYINVCLQKGAFEELVKILQEKRSIVKEDNDLSNLYYLSGVYEKERQIGNITLYKKDLKETLEVFYELQRRIRRLEWWEDYELQEIYFYMIEKKLSVYELQWAIETTCVDKTKVWRLLNEK